MKIKIIEIIMKKTIRLWVIIIKNKIIMFLNKIEIQIKIIMNNKIQ